MLRLALTRLALDQDNRMLRAGFGKNKGSWFVRVDLWKMGFRLTKANDIEPEPKLGPGEGMKTAYAMRARLPHEDRPLDTDVLCDGWAEVIICLVEQGPVDDGDIPSKSARNELIHRGFASKVIVQGEEAGNVATYRGRDLYCQLVDAFPLKDAIAKRRANPNFLNDLWKSQKR